MFYGSLPIVTDGLILHLDAGNPTSYTSGSRTWYDLSGQENHAGLANAVTYSNGGFSFNNNVANYISGSTNNFTSSMSASNHRGYTIISMINCSNWGARNTIFSHLTSSATPVPGGYIFEIGTAVGNFTSSSRAYVVSGTGNGGDIRGTFPFINNSPYIMAATFDSASTSQSLYVNGINIKAPLTTTYSGITTVHNWDLTPMVYTIGGAPFYGAAGLSTAFSGSIYSIAVYNRALSNAEIQQNFEAQRARLGI
jgi:hypothetical protein